jgi:hypothetical protein
MSKHEQQQSDRWAEATLRAQSRWEETKLITDGLKHLTTLAAGAIVLLATFLKDIFPKKNGALAVSGDLKMLIAMSFVLLGLSLLSSIFYIVLIAPPRRLAYEVEEGTSEAEAELERMRVLGQERVRLVRRTSWLRLLSAAAFSLGILCFGAAVLINLNVF